MVQARAFPQSLASIKLNQQNTGGTVQNGENSRLLTEVLKEVESKFSIFFTYKNKTLEGKIVNINELQLAEFGQSNQKFEIFLAELLNAQKLKFKKIDNIYFIYAESEKINHKLIERKTNKWLNSNKEPEKLEIDESYYISNLRPLREMRLAQAITVSGKITGDNNEALPGVNVIVKGTSNGTTSDPEGRYSISVTDENSVLVFSYIGFTTEEVTVGNRSIIDVKMLPDIKSLAK
jgi:hypothetical protein